MAAQILLSRFHGISSDAMKASGAEALAVLIGLLFLARGIAERNEPEIAISLACLALIAYTLIKESKRDKKG